jgi:glycosyltransferase involved in cell wall biosynthesis
MRSLPDRVPPDVSNSLASKARVLPVAVDVANLATGPARWPGSASEEVLRLLWVGRFEYDKGGERLLALLRRLESTGVDYEIAVTGQQFRRSPPVFDQIAEEFGARLAHLGYLDNVADYHALLRSADIVLSTALHEFQGLAVIEAVAAGCVPLVPDRLAYQEIYPEHCRYASFPDDVEREATVALECLMRAREAIRNGTVAVPDVAHFSLAGLAPLYRQTLADLAVGTG